jgi:hypothetical protein
VQLGFIRRRKEGKNTKSVASVACGNQKPKNPQIGHPPVADPPLPRAQFGFIPRIRPAQAISSFFRVQPDLRPANLCTPCTGMHKAPPSAQARTVANPPLPRVQFGFVPRTRPAQPPSVRFFESSAPSVPRICASRAQKCTKPSPRNAQKPRSLHTGRLPAGPTAFSSFFRVPLHPGHLCTPCTRMHKAHPHARHTQKPSSHHICDPPVANPLLPRVQFGFVSRIPPAQPPARNLCKPCTRMHKAPPHPSHRPAYGPPSFTGPPSPHKV